MNIKNFEASTGWLTKFNKRHGISFKTICEESAAVDIETAQAWINILPRLIKDYEPKDYYETGLFFKCLPSKF
jgi:hypothetical protein